jgi:hypothetical protein
MGDSARGVRWDIQSSTYNSARLHGTTLVRTFDFAEGRVLYRANLHGVHHLRGFLYRARQHVQLRGGPRSLPQKRAG